MIAETAVTFIYWLSVPAVSIIGSRGFSYAAPSLWDEIPLEICNSSSLASFKKHLEALFFLCLSLASPPRFSLQIQPNC